jgi:hypothetical protein
MTHDAYHNSCGCGRVSRRGFLADVGMRFTGLALGAMLARDGVTRRAAGAEAARAWSPPSGLPTIAPKAKSVIWLFMIGGTSHVESFDPKPALTKYAGKTFTETGIANPLDSALTKKNLREVIAGLHNSHSNIFPLQVGYKKRGQSGIEVSDWFPHVGSCVDDLAIVRSMWTTDNNHGAQLQFHTGRHALDGYFPTIGAWVHYGLGSLNDNLPQFVVLGKPVADCCGGSFAHSADYLGPEHTGVLLEVGKHEPLPFAAAPRGVYQQEAQKQFELTGRLDRLAAAEYPQDAAMRARIKAYELAFRMQMSIPDVLKFADETPATHELYGLDKPKTKPFGELCLTARRLVERGTRFVQVFHGADGGAGQWDAHGGLKTNHTNLCEETDKPIAALIKDLKQRGLLDETLVVWATEFGRTPAAQGADGRDHHPFGFSVWLAGGGIKAGITHGATDELGFHAVEDRHYVTDIHATVLRQLGLDPRLLEVPGRKRLEIDFGNPITPIIA